MSKPSSNSDSILDLSEPMSPGADQFVRTVHGLLDGKPKDDAMVEKAFEGQDDAFDLVAAGLYNMASMLVGEGEASIEIVEAAVANADLVDCEDSEASRRSGKRALAREALTRIAAHDGESLAVPEGLEHAQTCIEDDDLDAAGVSREEFERLIAEPGQGRGRVREWLESLPAFMRTVFVLRAVGGISAPEVAELLAAHGGPNAAGWTADAVREVFRQGLCSLASQLLHEGMKS
jgi:hypothetical protein